jgi:hypothetical protein
MTPSLKAQQRLSKSHILIKIVHLFRTVLRVRRTAQYSPLSSCTTRWNRGSSFPCSPSASAAISGTSSRGTLYSDSVLFKPRSSTSLSASSGQPPAHTTAHTARTSG